MPPEPARVLLVDDEPLVRSALRDALARLDEVAVIGEAVDGLSAIDAIERLRPDLVLLDVQMPGCDGFEVLAHFDAADRPAVVFVTAFEQYALRAFDAHAVDYLLKPFDDARLLAAVDRALTWLGRAGAPAGPPTSAVPALLADVAATRRRERFVVKHAGRLRLVPASEVDWIEARGNYVYLHHPDGPFLLRETMNVLAASLDPARFVRVHRSAIVALPGVVAIEPLGGGYHELLLRAGTRVRLGRRYRAAFEGAWRRDGPLGSEGR